jgi:predicted nuclease of predicted toxin-antitoxin system
MTALRFLLDEHISPDVAIELRRAGIECQALREIARLGLSDESHLRWAHENGYVFVTFDRDFLRLSAAGMAHRGVVFFTRGQTGADVVTPALRLLAATEAMEDLSGSVRFL